MADSKMAVAAPAGPNWLINTALAMVGWGFLGIGSKYASTQNITPGLAVVFQKTAEMIYVLFSILSRSVGAVCLLWIAYCSTVSCVLTCYFAVCITVVVLRASITMGRSVGTRRTCASFFCSRSPAPSRCDIGVRAERNLSHQFSVVVDVGRRVCCSPPYERGVLFVYYRAI